MGKNKERRRIKRQVRAIKGAPQLDLFGAGPGRGAPRREVEKGFVRADPKHIYFNDRPLEEFLQAMGLGWVVGFRALIDELDLSEFEARYDLRGRAPYHPASLLGLVIYGTMMGNGSLRAMEELARRDLGAIWLTGGLCPDHATIGRFVQMHEASITGPFYEQLTRQIVARMGKSSTLAGDGSIFEAAASRYQLIKKEAAEAAAKEAHEKAEAAPDDPKAQKAAERAAAVAEAAQERHEAQGRREAKPNVRVTATEPEAPALKGKRGETTPAYVASVIADENRIVRAADVTRTDETKSVAPMLEQALRVDPEARTVLFDGGYATGQVAQTAVDYDFDLLSPPKDDDRHGFPKRVFRYSEARDVYVCPAGQELTYRGDSTDKRRGSTYRRYAALSATCRACPLKDKCVTGKTRVYRVIQRFDNDEAMEALRERMKQRDAPTRIARRKAMVEPVFADLRGPQRFRRFTRFGLRGARLDFFLQVSAYNVRRLVAARGRQSLSDALMALLRVARATRRKLGGLRGVLAPTRSRPPAWAAAWPA